MGRIVDMPLPRLGETMDEGRIGLIIKKPGEKFRRGEILLEVESDKTTVEVPALQDGILIEWLVATDQMVPVESAIARIEIEGDALVEAKRPAARKPVAAPAAADHHVEHAAMTRGPRPRASTAARATARKSGIDLSAIAGTGRHGRVTREDLANAARPPRAAYHVEAARGNIFVREWQAQGEAKGNALLLHGLFSDSQSFTALGRMLAAKGLRTFAPDFPGHGETAASAATIDDIATATMAGVPSANFHIVAHSFGAVIAARLIGRAQSITLLSPAGCGEEINSEFVEAMLKANVGHALEFLGEIIPAEAQGSLIGCLSANAAQLRAIAGEIAESGRQKVSIVSALASARIPVQAIFMRDDQVMPSHHALNMPFNVAVRIMPGFSHLAHWRDPDAVAALITAFAR
jgi:pimeloyl-ACP methyl ester carboxylesterase